MNNSLNKENDQFLETIKSTIGKDIIETKVFFNDYQIITSLRKNYLLHFVIKTNLDKSSQRIVSIRVVTHIPINKRRFFIG